MLLCGKNQYSSNCVRATNNQCLGSRRFQDSYSSILWPSNFDFEGGINFFISSRCYRPKPHDQALTANPQVLLTHAQELVLTSPTEFAVYYFYHKIKCRATNDCEQLQKLSYEECNNFLMKSKVYLKCVSSNKHVAKECKGDKLECRICQQKYAAVLHDPTRHLKKESSQSSSTSAC